MLTLSFHMWCYCLFIVPVLSLLKGASGEYGAMGEQGTPGADVSTIHDKIRKTANCFYNVNKGLCCLLLQVRFDQLRLQRK